MFQRKVDGPLQMLIDCGRALVGVGDHFVQKGEISRFCQILVDSREQPKCIIGAVGGVTCFLHIAGVIGGCPHDRDCV